MFEVIRENSFKISSNVTKSVFFYIVPASPTFLNLSIDSSPIPTSLCMMSLGFILDSMLSFEKYTVTYIDYCPAIAMNCLCKPLAAKSMATSIHALTYSIDYCNSITQIHPWTLNGPNQNAIYRTSLQFVNSSTHFPLCIVFNLSFLHTFKALHNLVSPYFSERLQPYSVLSNLPLPIFVFHLPTKSQRAWVPSAVLPVHL